jgi:hypothetical protein
MAKEKAGEADLKELREAQKRAATEAAEALKNIVEGLGDVALDLPLIYERLLMFDAGAAIDTLRAQGELSLLRARCFELLNAAMHGTEDDSRN